MVRRLSASVGKSQERLLLGTQAPRYPVNKDNRRLKPYSDFLASLHSIQYRKEEMSTAPGNLKGSLSWMCFHRDFRWSHGPGLGQSVSAGACPIYFLSPFLGLHRLGSQDRGFLDYRLGI